MRQQGLNPLNRGGEGGGGVTGGVTEGGLGDGEGVWLLEALRRGEEAEETSGDDSYDYLVLKHAMISRACR